MAYVHGVAAVFSILLLLPLSLNMTASSLEIADLKSPVLLDSMLLSQFIIDIFKISISKC